MTWLDTRRNSRTLSSNGETTINDFSCVTVVVPAYNSEATLPAAVASVFKILPGARLVVVDDGSEDQTSTVAERLGVEVLTQSNRGASAARSEGLRLVTTEYVVLLDSDDEVAQGMPDALQLIKESGAVVVGGRVEIIDSERKFQRLTRQPPSAMATSDLLQQSFSPWPPSAAIWRHRAILDSYGLAPEKLATQYAEDFELLIRVSQLGKVLSVNYPTCRYAASGGKSAKSALAAVQDSETIREYYADALGVHYNQLSRVGTQDQAAWRQFRANQAENGDVHVIRLLLAQPADSVLRITRHHFRNTVRRTRISTVAHYLRHSGRGK